MATKLDQSVHKLPRRNSKTGCHPQHSWQGRHAVPPLDIRGERRMQPCRLSQGLLSQTMVEPDLLEPRTERRSDLDVACTFLSGHGV